MAAAVRKAEMAALDGGEGRWGVDLRTFLADKGLQKYEDMLVEKGVTLDALLHLDVSGLTQLGVAKGSQVKIRAAQAAQRAVVKQATVEPAGQLQGTEPEAEDPTPTAIKTARSGQKPSVLSHAPRARRARTPDWRCPTESCPNSGGTGFNLCFGSRPRCKLCGAANPYYTDSTSLKNVRDRGGTHQKKITAEPTSLSCDANALPEVVENMASYMESSVHDSMMVADLVHKFYKSREGRDKKKDVDMKGQKATVFLEQFPGVFRLTGPDPHGQVRVHLVRDRKRRHENTHGIIVNTPNAIHVMGEIDIRTNTTDEATTKLCFSAGSVVMFGVGSSWPQRRVAIVNAANCGGIGGGGVDDAIAVAGGSTLAADRRKLPILRRTMTEVVRIETGDVMPTGPGNYGALFGAFVLHAVGPDYRGCGNDQDLLVRKDQQLMRAYVQSLECAKLNSIEFLAFPLLSAGIFRGSSRSIEDMIQLAARAVRGAVYPALREVHLIAFSDDEHTACVDCFKSIEQRSKSRPGRVEPEADDEGEHVAVAEAACVKVEDEPSPEPERGDNVDQIERLMEMGFSQKQCTQAMDVAALNVASAVEFLIRGEIPATDDQHISVHKKSSHVITTTSGSVPVDSVELPARGDLVERVALEHALLHSRVDSSAAPASAEPEIEIELEPEPEPEIANESIATAAKGMVWMHLDTGQKDAAIMLGWKMPSWGYRVSACKSPLGQLTEVQQQAAATLGYDAESWGKKWDAESRAEDWVTQRLGSVTRLMQHFCIVDNEIYCPHKAFADGPLPTLHGRVKVDIIPHQEGQNKWKALNAVVCTGQKASVLSHAPRRGARTPDWRCPTESCANSGGNLCFGSRPRCKRCGAANPSSTPAHRGVTESGTLVLARSNTSTEPEGERALQHGALVARTAQTAATQQVGFQQKKQEIPREEVAQDVAERESLLLCLQEERAEMAGRLHVAEAKLKAKDITPDFAQIQAEQAELALVASRLSVRETALKAEKSRAIVAEAQLAEMRVEHEKHKEVATFREHDLLSRAEQQRSSMNHRLQKTEAAYLENVEKLRVQADSQMALELQTKVEHAEEIEKLRIELDKATLEKQYLPTSASAGMRMVPTWECEVDSVWREYPDPIAIKLQAARESRQSCSFERDTHIYTVDFGLDDQNLVQTNQQTGVTRKIRPGAPRVRPTSFLDSVKLPDEWEPMPPGRHCHLQPIKEGSPAWRDIAKCMVISGPIKPQLKQIYRVQNDPLWRSFEMEKDRMKRELGTDPKEIDVWHGTSKTDPKAIYSDKQDGFMMQRASEGMWGKGNYFAEKFEYSYRGYAHNSPDGAKELLFVKLLVGCAVELPCDATLKFPPLRTDGSELRYNSVTGHTCNSRVYITYENKRAYPQYLVQYTTRA